MIGQQDFERLIRKEHRGVCGRYVGKEPKKEISHPLSNRGLVSTQEVQNES